MSTINPETTQADASSTDEWQADFPYPGLRPFKADEGVKFFGRRNQVTELLSRLAGKNQAVFIVGPSGCGKSSIVRPGLFDALEVGRLPSAVGRWNFVDFKPGSDPLLNLCQAIRSSLPEIVEKQKDESTTLNYLSTTGGLRDVLNLRNVNDNSFTLLLADQFEEVLPDQSDRQVPDSNLRFIRALTELFYNPLPGVFLVFTMRSDYIGDCTAFNELPDVINSTQYLVKPMDGADLRSALSTPAEERGIEVEPALIQRIIDDIQIEKNNDYERGFDLLPLAQHVMSRIWKKAVPKGVDPCEQWYEFEPDSEDVFTLRLQHYIDIGTLSGALNQHANEIYKYSRIKDTKQKELLQRITEVILKRITRRTSDGKYIRSPTGKSKLVKLCLEFESKRPGGSSTEAVKDGLDLVLEKLSAEGCCFLALDNEAGSSGKRVNIGHEALIRQWAKLREWTKEEARVAWVYKTLLSYTNVWIENGKSANGKGIVDGHDLDDLITWDKQKVFNEKWALRYGGQYKDAQSCLEASKHKRESALRSKLLKRAITGIVVLGIIVFAVIYNNSQNYIKEADILIEEADILIEKADTWRQRTEATQLASEAIRTRNNHPQYSARLAILAAAKSYLAEKDHIAPDIRRSIESILQPLPTTSRFVGHQDDILAIAISGDGSKMLTGSADQSAQVWDAKLGWPLVSLRNPNGSGGSGAINDVAFSPDNKFAVTASHNSVSIWEVKSGRQITRLSGTAPISFSPGGKEFIVGGCPVIIYKVAKWEEHLRLPEESCKNDTGVLAAGFGRSISELVVGDWAGNLSLNIFDEDHPKSPPKIISLTGSKKPFRNLERLPSKIHFLISRVSDNELMVTVDKNMTANIWDLNKGANSGEYLLASVQINKHFVFGLDLSADGKTIALAIDSGEVVLLDVPSIIKFKSKLSLDKVTPLSDIPGTVYSVGKHRGHAKDIVFSSDGEWVTSVGADGVIMKTRVTTGEMKRRFIMHKRTLSSVTQSPGGNSIITTSHDGSAMIWGAENMAHKKTLSIGHTGFAYSVEVSPDGEKVVTTDANGIIKLWDSMNGELIATFPIQNDRVYDASFSPNGETVVAVGKNNVISVWDITGCKSNTDCPMPQIAAIPHPISSGILAAEFGNDNDVVVTASTDGRIRLWDVPGASFKTGGKPPGRPSELVDLALDSERGLVAAASYDGNAWVWNMNFNSPPVAFNHSKFTPQANPVTAVVFVPNFERQQNEQSNSTTTSIPDILVSGDSRGNVLIWNKGAGSEPRVLPNFGSEVFDLKYDPLSRALAIALENGKVVLWNMEKHYGENLFLGGKIFGLSFDPRGTTLYMSSSTGEIRKWAFRKKPTDSIWDYRSGGRLNVDLLGSNPIMTAAYINDGDLLVADIGGQVTRWKSNQTGTDNTTDLYRDGNSMKSFSTTMRNVQLLKKKPISDGVLSISQERTGTRKVSMDYWILHDTNTSGDVVRKFSREFDKLIIDVEFSPAGDKLLLKHDKFRYSLWELDDDSGFKEIQDKLLQNTRIELAVFDAKGASIIAVPPINDSDGAGFRYDISSKQQIPLNIDFYDHHPGERIEALHISPTGQYLLTIGSKEKVNVWTSSNGQFGLVDSYAKGKGHTLGIVLDKAEKSLLIFTQAKAIHHEINDFTKKSDNEVVDLLVDVTDNNIALNPEECDLILSDKLLAFEVGNIESVKNLLDNFEYNCPTN